MTEVLPPEIVVEEDRGPAEPTQAQTSDDGLIVRPSLSLSSPAVCSKMGLQIESAASVNPALTIVDNAGESEKTETQVVEEKVVPDVERPKSPWTPSYSVTTQGPGVTSVDVPEEEDDQKTDADSPVDVEADKVIEESTGNGAAIVASTEVCCYSLPACN